MVVYVKCCGTSSATSIQAKDLLIKLNGTVIPRYASKQTNARRQLISNKSTVGIVDFVLLLLFHDSLYKHL